MYCLCYRQAAPKWLLVGSYPKGVNALVDLGGYFAINLMAPPFSLLPTYIYSEDTADLKHVFVYTAADMQAWDLDAVQKRMGPVTA